MQRPDVKLTEPVAMALRLGAFQLLHLDRIPAHAALSESVELVRAAGIRIAAGMVNAVLRKLATCAEARRKLHESTAAFAERLGHPRGWWSAGCGVWPRCGDADLRVRPARTGAGALVCAG